jgi:manganese efflux pump family protein
LAIAALVTWLITASFGFFMLIRWASRGGVRRVAGADTHFPPVRVFSHVGLAAAGLIIWIVYLVTDSSVLAWIAFVDLVLVALIGGVLVRRWTLDGRAAMQAGDRVEANKVDLAEQHIPRPAVVLHGIFASSTLLLVLLTALGIGES